MRKHPSLVALLPLFLISCGTFGPASGPDARSEALILPAAMPETSASAPAVTRSEVVVPGARADDGGSSYTMVKVGPFYGQGDLEDLDTGLWVEAVFGHEVLPFLSIEGVVGYMRAEESGQMVNAELWAIPVMAQARVSLPIAIFEPYAGLGIGGMYVDAQAGPFETTDFVLAGDAFLGVAVGLGNLAVGLEGKYIVTDEIEDDFKVEGIAGTIFVSFPF